VLLDPSDQKPVHFIGIAGAGMSALAELFLRRGARVTGCDASAEGHEDLRRLGIAVTHGHDASHIDEARAVVVTSAMDKNHPELARARALGLPVVRRAEALGEATSGDGRVLVAVGGTHGKSTTTAMVAEALASARLDPTALVGARVAKWNGNLRGGGDRLYVAEADEYDRSFLALSPTVAVVTNVEADHLDIYKDLADIRGAFEQFIRGASHVVVCADDAGASTLRTPSSSEVISFGLSPKNARLVAHDVQLAPTGTTFIVTYDGDKLGPGRLRVPGAHNVLNALAAFGAGLALGAPFDQLASGLAEFAGTGRRFELLGDANGVTVIDDYAHHPTEIEATLLAARASYPGRRLVVAFQPHLFSRTRDFALGFANALCRGDAVFLTEIYPSREQPIAGVTAELIVAGFGKERGKLAWRGERSALAEALAAAVDRGDVVITMGAGDITKTGPELLARLRKAA
jgi:UDP-N-acetylmuramate--alanine ligase